MMIALVIKRTTTDDGTSNHTISRYTSIPYVLLQLYVRHVDSAHEHSTTIPRLEAAKRMWDAYRDTIPPSNMTRRVRRTVESIPLSILLRPLHPT